MPIQLSQGFSTDYCVVVPDSAIPSERYAAEECAHFLSEITGAYFPIIYPGKSNSYRHSIIIGHGPEAEKRGVLPNPALGNEGYEIKIAGNDLVIAGGKPRGTLYGVYALLEEDIGCRWFTPYLQHIPKRRDLILGDVDRTFRPILEFREDFYGAAFDGDWNARNRLNGISDQLYSKHGDKVMGSEHSAHTFQFLVPPEKYFAEHPEYFSLVNGQRLGTEETQLCLTNPDVLKIALQTARQWLIDYPQTTLLSISQNDFYNPCECEHCKEIDEREGSHSGSLIWFVNKVAEDLERDYPDLVIHTLAYQYTRPAPKHIRTRPNVCVQLCSIECCFGHPFDECDVIAERYTDLVEPGASFQKDLRDWAKVCDRVYIWDYVTNFFHYCMPFPNLDVLQPNIQFMVQNSVKGVFEQGNYACGGGPDFNELRTWMLAKLLWNPYCDIAAVRAEFMHAFYGKAAPALDAYLNLIHKRVRDEHIHFGIFDHANVSYITDDMLPEIHSLFDEAERLADDDQILWRVRRARMSIRYLVMARRIESGEATTCEVDEYFADMTRFGLARVSEWLDMDEDRQRIIKKLSTKV